MGAWPDELVIIQQEEDGSYRYELRELGIGNTWNMLGSVLVDIEQVLERQDGTPVNSRRLAQIDKDIKMLQEKIDKLTDEAHQLELEKPPILASELLEEMDKVRSVARLFEIDHPLESVWGDIVAIGFLVRRDIDGDGDLDIEPVLHARRVI